MSKSRQSKIEQVRQESITKLQEARLTALHQKGKDTPFLSEEAKQGGAPPPPPGAAAGASGGGSSEGTAFSYLKCNLPGMCNPNNEFLKNVLRTQMEWNDIEAGQPNFETTVCNEGIIDCWKTQQGDWGKKMDEYGLGLFQRNSCSGEGGGVQKDDVDCQPRTGELWTENSQGPIFKAHKYIGPNPDVWGWPFKITVKPAVASVPNLPAIGLDGDATYVCDLGTWVFWGMGEDEEGWNSDLTNEDALGTDKTLLKRWNLKGSTQDSIQKEVGNFSQASAPFVVAAVQIPLFQTKKYGKAVGEA